MPKILIRKKTDTGAHHQNTGSEIVIKPNYIVHRKRSISLARVLRLVLLIPRDSALRACGTEFPLQTMSSTEYIYIYIYKKAIV